MNKTQKTKTSRNILKIGVTGGIGSGKSYVCHLLEDMGFPIFYCDEEAKRIIRNDLKVREALKALVGEEVYDQEGQLNKSCLRDFICESKKHAGQVDAIVHPRVGEYFEAWSRQQSTATVFMECAILFESGFNKYVDQVLHVTAPLEMRIARVMKRDQISREKALGWMSLQMPEEEKEKRADFIIRNDEESDIISQIRQIIKD